MVVNYLNGIDYAIICLYLGAIVALGLQLKRRASASLEQYLLGGRSMAQVASIVEAPQGSRCTTEPRSLGRGDFNECDRRRG